MDSIQLSLPEMARKVVVGRGKSALHVPPFAKEEVSSPDRAPWVYYYAEMNRSLQVGIIHLLQAGCLPASRQQPPAWVYGKDGI